MKFSVHALRSRESGLYDCTAKSLTIKFDHLSEPCDINMVKGKFMFI